MKCKGILALVLIFTVNLFTITSAEQEQLASAYVKADLKGKIVCQVTIDLTDRWSVRFEPSTIYLYDHAFDPAEVGLLDYAAFVSLCTKEDYDSTLEEWAKDGTEYEERKGYIVAPCWDDMTQYIKPIDEEVYLQVIIFNTVNAEDVLARIVSCERKVYTEPVEESE